MKFTDYLNETYIVNNPEKGIEIRPSGGLGTWDEESLRTSITRQLDELSKRMKANDYKGVEYLLYGAGALEAKIKALAQFEKFMDKQGKRPIAKGKEIKIGD